MKKDNRGLSLVELIVAIAILAIAGVAICGFVSYCSKSYANSNKSVKLQYDQQLVVNRVKDVVLETSRGLSYDPTAHKLLVFSDNPETTGPSDRCLVTQISLDSTNHSLLIKSEKMSDSTKVVDINLSPTSKLSDCVENFEVDDSLLVSDGKVTLKFTFLIGEKKVETSTVVALRNMIAKLDSSSDEEIGKMYEGETIEIYSPIASVVIYRDGKPFSQAKTDTIAMAAGSNNTSAAYTAVVTKKSSYNKSIDTSVDWSLDLSTLKAGYEKCISIDAYGKVTIMNELNPDGSVKHTPNDYISGSYFAIIASSSSANPGEVKSAKLRIKVTTGGIYPKTIATSYTTTEDRINGQLIYQFSHEITYTGSIEDPVSKKKVNPLKGAGAFTKIAYTVEGGAVPSGAGFGNSGIVDGKFIATKSMEGKTFKITTSVIQKDQNGSPVTSVTEITIGKVPSQNPDITEPVLGGAETAVRGTVNLFTGSWTKGVPQYQATVNFDGSNIKADKPYYYWCEYEIEPDPECKNWGNGKNNTFSKLVYLSSNDGKSNYGTSKVMDQFNRSIAVKILPNLQWDKSYTFKVNMRMKISQKNNLNSASYYKMPTKDDMSDIFTNKKDEAYFVTRTISIDPVTVSLKPVEVKLHNGQNKTDPLLKSSFSTNDTIGKGTKNCQYNTNAEETYYYKMFSPTFTGISVTIFNYEDNLGLVDRSKGNEWYAPPSGLTTPKQIEGNESKLWLYFGNNTYDKKVYDSNKKPKGFESGFKFNKDIDNKLYVYLKMHPLDWIGNNAQKLPQSLIWVCDICDNSGNSVIATFTDTNEKSRQYIIKPEWNIK